MGKLFSIAGRALRIGFDIYHTIFILGVIVSGLFFFLTAKQPLADRLLNAALYSLAVGAIIAALIWGRRKLRRILGRRSGAMAKRIDPPSQPSAIKPAINDHTGPVIWRKRRR